MLKERIQGYIDKVMAMEGIRGCALVSRDGVMLGTSPSIGANQTWIAAMAATLHSSAESAMQLLKAGTPRIVQVYGDDLCLNVAGAGERVLIVALTDKNPEKTDDMTRLLTIAEEIGEVF